MYAELVETLVHGFRKAGHEAAPSFNRPDPRAINVLLNAHEWPAEAASHLPPDTVVFNLEHIEDRTWDWAPTLKVFLSRFETWDYSRTNVERLKGLCPRVFWLPVGWEPELTRIPKAKVQDIDVLFYGAINPRRRPVLEAIAARGLHLETPFGVYGRERDALIARSKVVVNIHQEADRALEMVRVSYLLANRKAVVTETSRGIDEEPGLAEAMAIADVDALPAACEALVRNDGRRRALELGGHRWMAARRQSVAIRDLLRLRDKAGSMAPRK